MDEAQSEGPLELALCGDLTESEAELTDKLLAVEPGGECTLYIDSPGGSPYCAMSLTSLIMLRGLRVTGIVTGECSSAALWPFAACRRRMVTPYSVLLFHPMKWQSEEHVGLHEASEWARHFAQLETDMDRFLAELFGPSKSDIQQWIISHRYVSGSELASAGLAELIDFKMLDMFRTGHAGRAGMPRRQIISMPKPRGDQPRNVERNKRAAKRK
ncbi:MAG TPA: ATP-dependent Clp protease proteolytic subunit [Pirellulales bacterium]|jgi:ATP-dependent protease ClpP protease subunit|nr:ATP-dependent Clp protease proteolytic subunit [Pirellulales bacterium]